MKTKTILSFPYILSFSTSYKQSDDYLEYYKKTNHPILPIIKWQKQ